MNKLALIILGLAVFAAVAFAQDLVSEIDEEDDLGTDGEAGRFRAEWGYKDYLQDGTGNYNEKRASQCPKMKNEEKCKICCTGLGMAHNFDRLKMDGMHIGKCTCFKKAM